MSHPQNQPSSSNWFWSIAVFTAAVAQPITSQFSRLTGIGTPIENLPQPYVSPEEPEGYAFIIWAVIFGLALAYAVKQLLSRPSNEELLKEIRPASALLFGLSSAWMISAQVWGNGSPLVAIILAMFGTSIYLLQATYKELDKGTFHRWVIDPLYGLFAGWLTLAAFLNAGSAVRDMFGTYGLSPVAFAAAILLPSGLAALAVTALTRGSWWYSGAVVWGLIAVIVTNIGTTASMEIIALCVGLTVALLAWTAWVRGARSVTAPPEPRHLCEP